LETRPDERYPAREGVQHYRRYKEDMALLGAMGLKAYRFSISWSRIFPRGDESAPNASGLQFYRDLVRECRRNGMEPVVTISHFEAPLGLVELIGSWRSREMIDHYLRLCRVLFTSLPEVRYWITFNEINMIMHAPFLAAGVVIDSQEDAARVTFQAAHHQLVASALAARMARQMLPASRIGCMFAAACVYPLTCRPQDVLKAMQVGEEDFYFVDVQVRGHYSRRMRKAMERAGVSIEVEPDDAQVLAANTVDFISFSYYNSRTVAEDEEGVEASQGNLFSTVKNPYLSQSQWGWAIDPVGFRITLNQIQARYDKPMFVVENGLGAVDLVDERGGIDDRYRIEYMRDHIREMIAAVEEDGVDLIGYLWWGPIDLVSASSGEMRKRYGLIHVECDDEGRGSMDRRPKRSFHWYKRLIASRGADLE